jgi:hypothetical protein
MHQKQSSQYVIGFSYEKSAGQRNRHWGDFKVGVSVGVYCTKCTLNTGVNTNIEITQCFLFGKIL